MFVFLILLLCSTGLISQNQIVINLCFLFYFTTLVGVTYSWHLHLLNQYKSIDQEFGQLRKLRYTKSDIEKIYHTEVRNFNILFACLSLLMPSIMVIKELINKNTTIEFTFVFYLIFVVVFLFFGSLKKSDY